MHAENALTLNSHETQLHISQSTGKITELKVRGQNLLVDALPNERQRALSADDRQLFESLDAWGADECYPTIGRSTLWNLRDHGNIWARTPKLIYARENHCFTGWDTHGSHFKRVVSALPHSGHANTLGAFLLQVTYPSQLPLQMSDGSQKSDLHVMPTYASHALFAAEPGDRVEWSLLSGVTDLESAVGQPQPRNVLSSQIFARDAQPIASKFYLRTSATQIFVTSLIREKLRLRIDVLQDASLPWVGVWWCHNGWGDGRPHSTVGIEPSNFPSDGPILGFPGFDPFSEQNVQFCWVISSI